MHFEEATDDHPVGLKDKASKNTIVNAAKIKVSISN